MDKRRISYIVLVVVFTIAFVLIGAFIFSSSYLRLGETFVDLWHSIKFYFCELFEIETDFDVSVILPSDEINHESTLPGEFEEFQGQTVTYFDAFFSKENFVLWGYHVLDVLGKTAKILTLILPIILVGFLIIRTSYGQINTKHNIDTIPLKIFKQTSRFTYQPTKRYILGFVDFLSEYRLILFAWLLIWLCNLNLLSIVIAFLAYYFYFAISFNVASIYTQFVKLFTDLQILFKDFPWYLFLPLVVLLFDRWRKNRATDRLNHYELRNRGFINELPIVSMTCGSMGKKKTTTVTDMALSQEVMFRDKAYELLIKNDMKFQYFPWLAFEMELQKCMQYGYVYNLATCKELVRKKKARFEKHHNADLQLYGYDYEKYGLNHYDGLKDSSLFDVLETYAQLYFIYVIESSLIVSNYSIREDNYLMTEGNFPMWISNFFPRHRSPYSRHAHILDFDVLRLGKKVIENNPNNGSFEFGVVVITEVGKERGNTLELKDVKKATNETNQKNDLFNNWLKMCRHAATVDGFPFIKVFTDEQRPESWGADARDLCDIITIVKSGEQRCTLPFYIYEEMVEEWAFNIFKRLYENLRYKRGDNTLLVYLLKSIAGRLFNHNIKMYNEYGVSELSVAKERGIMDGKKRMQRYYIMNKKAYSDRFSTDCFSDYFNDLAKKAKIGLPDYREYISTKASVDELKYQNSYFISSLYSDKVQDEKISR